MQYLPEETKSSLFIFRFQKSNIEKRILNISVSKIGDHRRWRNYSKMKILFKACGFFALFVPNSKIILSLSFSKAKIKSNKIISLVKKPNQEQLQSYRLNLKKNLTFLQLKRRQKYVVLFAAQTYENA